MSIEEIRQSASSGQLIVVLGAGASIALMPKSKKGLSWIGLVRSGLDYGRNRGLINDSQYHRHLDALASDDIDDLLGVAEFVGRKLESPHGDIYARWMRSVFESWKPEAGGMQNALRAIDVQKIPIATLNYDTMAEVCTGASSIDFANNEALMGWMRKEKEGILHLHGVWTNPANCIFGIRDYQSTLSDEMRQFVQRSLGSLNRILFIGCSDTFSDPNFSALISWLRKYTGANTPQHYALVRDIEVHKRLADESWRGFVEPIAYGSDFNELPAFLLNCFPTRRSPTAHASKEKTAARRDAEVIEAYRSFLLRDCGEMTIEGMRADMDTAQRKFDLEKLFVPLDVTPFPPEIPLADPERHIKTQKWLAENSKPISFSSAFEKTRKIALLALPGGGKTLLLKRLAVAYASSQRREASSDKLPPLDLVPVMIRCREWKEHIRKPIPTLLKCIASITGEISLEGLALALEKQFKSGTVLLLIDGLDEIHDDADRSIFVENLEKFLERYPKIRLLVTSREAGFDLVAPCLIRFCSKFRIAPLSEQAITSLCEYWHRLMIGGTPEAIDEGQVVAGNLVKSEPLRRLAENPLLLTMLLVVKHGAGRLPPDRVSLYDRAVEVLLDTWNIKGHEALNVKEAVPQLACLAYELMRQGKQTATELEILKILTAARDALPMVGRYAKDSPHDFLKRVELRSSLMLEGGHTIENGKPVTFYQFRHLTFQEYLAAVSCVNGYTLSEEKNVSILASLKENLTSDEWKEVIPMAAVLARTQSGPLLNALVEAAESEKKDFLENQHSVGDKLTLENRLPPATSRLARAMIEEAVFLPGTLDKAVHLITFFAAGCHSNENWPALSRGPYGPDIRNAALSIFLDSPYAYPTLARNTVALLEAHAEPSGFWTSDHCEETLIARLNSQDVYNLARAILGVAGSFWIHRKEASLARSYNIYRCLEESLFDSREMIRTAAAWSWGFWRHLQGEIKRLKPKVDSKVVNHLVSMYIDEITGGSAGGIYSLNFVVAGLFGIRREDCSLTISRDKENILRKLIQNYEDGDISGHDHKMALIRITFLLNEVFDDNYVRKFIEKYPMASFEEAQCEDIFDALGISSSVEDKKRHGRRNPRTS